MRYNRFFAYTIALALGMGGAAPTPALAHSDKTFAGIGFEQVRAKWEVNSWTIWALPNHECIAMVQKVDVTPFNFWGFRVKNGLDVQVFFGSIADAKPQTIQFTYDDGPTVSYQATVEPFLEWNAYNIPLKLEDLWALPDELFFQVYAGGNKVTWGGTKIMGKIAEALERCDKWQEAH